MRWNSPELASLIDVSRQRLEVAGVASPDYDAALIAATLLGVPSHLGLRFVAPEEIPASFADEYEAAVARREKREPLQHILGSAPFGIHDLAVGPGVFIPRPETEVLAEWAAETLAQMERENPDDEFIVVDLGTGSGALAIYIAERAKPDLVIGVEKSLTALAAARDNAELVAGGLTELRFVRGDMTDPELLERFTGQVSLVITNPPYVPAVDSDSLDPEVHFDPQDAVFSGADGMDAIRGLVPVAARLLKPGGHLGIEHDDSTVEQTRGVVDKHGEFENVRSLTDLTGRERFVVASKLPG